MQALTSYLRKASEQNPSASYYNVEILKYQVSQPQSPRGLNPYKKTLFKKKKNALVKFCFFNLSVWGRSQRQNQIWALG